MPWPAFKWHLIFAIVDLTGIKSASTTFLGPKYSRVKASDVPPQQRRRCWGTVVHVCHLQSVLFAMPNRIIAEYEVKEEVPCPGQVDDNKCGTHHGDTGTRTFTNCVDALKCGEALPPVSSDCPSGSPPLGRDTLERTDLELRVPGA